LLLWFPENLFILGPALVALELYFHSTMAN
jgi:hypothetical protein